MKRYRYNTAIINIDGKINRQKVEEATKVFFTKMHKHKKNKTKGVDRLGGIKRRND